MKRSLLVLALAIAVVAIPAGWARRNPTPAERTAIVKSLPAFYHQSCITYVIRVSTVDTHFAAVFFRFPAKPPSAGNCQPFDGQVLMKRLSATRWKKIGEGSSWGCTTPGVTTKIVKDLFGSCDTGY